MQNEHVIFVKANNNGLDNNKGQNKNGKLCDTRKVMAASRSFVGELTRSAAKQMDTLTRKMELLREGKSLRPRIVVGNRADNVKCPQAIEELKG